jgi:hypothetical protein
MPIVSDPFGLLELDNTWPVDQAGQVIFDDAFYKLIAIRNKAANKNQPLPNMTYEEAQALIITSERSTGMPPVTKLQLRNAAKQIGLWDTMKAAINADPETKEVWELCTQVERDHDMVLGLAYAFGWTDDQLDSLFSLASQM